MIKNEKFRIHPNIVTRLIFGNRCRICAEITELNRDICSGCSTDKIRIEQSTLSSFSYADKSFDNLTSPFYYDEPVITCIHNFKYKNFRRAAEFLSSEIIEAIARDFADENPDFITCIPMTRIRKFRKNYNHGEVIIKYISKAFSVEAAPELLKKIKNTRSQVSLSGKERRKNLKASRSCKSGRKL